MNNDIKGNERELTDEEIEHVSGGTSGKQKRCASCLTEYDYNATECPNCGKSEYYIKRCGRCFLDFDYYIPVCPKCGFPFNSTPIYYPTHSIHSNPR